MSPSALGQTSLDRLLDRPTFIPTRNMAAVKDSKDTLCLFDVDGTVTPSRLVTLILWIVFLGERGFAGKIVCVFILFKGVGK